MRDRTPVAEVNGRTMRSLGSFSSRITQRNFSNDRNVLTISAKDGLVSQDDFFNRQVASVDLSQYYHLHRGDFAYNKSYSAGYPAGVVRQLELHDSGVVSPLYICFRVDPGIADPDFVSYYFESGILNDAILNIAKEGARNHGLLNVRVKDFFSLELSLPDIVEQRKIAEVLATVDRHISHCEAVLPKIAAIRDQVIEKLLFEALEFAPRARLEEVASVERGRFSIRPRNDPDYYGGPHFFIQTGDVVRAQGGLIEDAAQTLNQRGLSASREFPKGTVAVTIAATVGATAILGEKMCFPDSVVGVVARDGFEPRFLERCINRARHVLERLAPQSAQKNINLQDIRPLKIPRVDLGTQRRVVSIWDEFEVQRAVAQRELRKIRAQKQALMDDLLIGRVRVPVSAER
ncbi:restriction endonuclease subunit S [Streptomyces sp. NPDC058469]|uniref:restriction endonuclease subunit S n=1 Tax=Streptomyces sp. NPDC058469 TaxID=3346514 RepID=UPI00365A5127